jgi:hypothetical protein
MGRLFAEVRAPSTLGTFLSLFTFGHIEPARRGRRRIALVAATPVLSGWSRSPGVVAFGEAETRDR